MKHIKLAFLLVSAAAMGTTIFLDERVFASTDHAPGRYIVTFNNGIDEKKKNNLKNRGVRIVKDLALVQAVVVTAPNATTAKSLTELKDVARVEVDAVVKTAAVVSVPSPTVPWGVDRIDADKAWSKSQGRNIKVAVLDTGIDRTHPDIQSNLGGGVSYVLDADGYDDYAAYNDYHGHGTHVAGTIAAATNSIGVVGVAPKSKVYGVKVLSDTGSGYVSDVIRGIDWSINNRMNVVNMSLAISAHVQALEDALVKASASNVAVVVAAGNSGDGDPLTNDVAYPAKYASAITVGATDSADAMGYFSADGDEVDVVAPGVNVLSTYVNGTYATMSGTSMATPHVAGTVALLLATNIPTKADLDRNRKWSVAELQNHLKQTADDFGIAGKDVFYGHGLIDAGEAVTGLQTN